MNTRITVLRATEEQLIFLQKYPFIQINEPLYSIAEAVIKYLQTGERIQQAQSLDHNPLAKLYEEKWNERVNKEQCIVGARPEVIGTVLYIHPRLGPLVSVGGKWENYRKDNMWQAFFKTTTGRIRQVSLGTLAPYTLPPWKKRSKN